MTEEDEIKESVDEYEKNEYEKDERLDLEDNEPEYETEEYGGVDYDEKEIEQEDVPDGGDEVEEENEEGDVGEEEDGDVGEEGMEDVPEELEGEEDDEHAGELQEHAEMVDAEDEEHHEVFKERLGEVTEVRLMMNPQTKKNKGFAFLRFATVEQAKRAVTELKNPVVNGKQCGVTPSQDSDTLFLGNICKTWTKEALKEKLKHYGVENVEDLTLVEDSNNEGMNRGFAFLEFSSRSDAMDAFKRLQKRDVVFGVDRTAKVSFADSFIDPGDEIMAQMWLSFYDTCNAYWLRDRVRELLKKYGEIEKIELARNMPSAKRKDFGFVTFDTHDAAVTCAKSINNAELGEGENKAKVRARLSRPLQRGKGKHISRGDFRPGRGPRLPPAAVKRPIGFRDRRPVMAMPPRGRPLPPPSRSYDRRAPANLKRDYGRREEVPLRSRPAVDYGSRVAPERRPSYRDDYATRGSGYNDIPRNTSRTAARRTYEDDAYGQRFERPPPPSYREGRPRDYDSIAGSKRPYGALDDVPPRYADASVRQSRARLDYEMSAGASQYGDAYGDSRSSMSSQDSHGLYSSRQGMGYGGGSFGGSDVGGMYSSSYGSDYIPRGADVCSYPPPVVAKGLVVALTHLFIPVVVLVAAVTWVVVVLDHTIESLVARRLGMSLFLLRVVIGEYGAMWSHMNLSMAQIFDMTEAANSRLNQCWIKCYFQCDKPSTNIKVGNLEEGINELAENEIHAARPGIGKMQREDEVEK
ncbi:Heterogeneous nuclear ribonucleoprotein Q [Vitis vinifera]|uniref:Heterogeneous nuclear ribonucleoprotein Q n=1 Tax=Vitis vinifera TaxID=29760 RepID=A0A438BVK2_VITVI|nr:Heterogeneous nuclear ribonucleoprotein Q [Vitis vinifera]